MRRYLSCLLLIFLTVSCTHSTATSDKPSETTTTAQAVAIAACSEEGFCTREYLPTICQFNGQSFEASNPCEAKKLAKRFACEKNLPFADAGVACQSKPDKPLAATKNCGQRTFCTKEMNPQSCAFKGEKFRGNNRCEAIQKVRAFACERGFELDEKSVSCEPSKSPREQAG